MKISRLVKLLSGVVDMCIHNLWYYTEILFVADLENSNLAFLH